MKNFIRDNKGTTIVETAIAFFAIVALIGVVLVFRTLLDESHVRSQMKQIEEYRSAVRTFYGKHNAYPGDFSKAKAFGIGEDGNGDGKIGDIIDEEKLFWAHLAQEGLINYDANENLYPFARIGRGFVAIYFNTKDSTTYFHIGFPGNPNAYTLKPVEAYKIDLKLDDGNPITGNIQAKGAGKEEEFNVPPTIGPRGDGNDFCITDGSVPEYNTQNSKELCNLDVELRD